MIYMNFFSIIFLINLFHHFHLGYDFYFYHNRQKAKLIKILIIENLNFRYDFIICIVLFFDLHQTNIKPFIKFGIFSSCVKYSSKSFIPDIKAFSSIHDLKLYQSSQINGYDLKFFYYDDQF